MSRRAMLWKLVVEVLTGSKELRREAQTKRQLLAQKFRIRDLEDELEIARLERDEALDAVNAADDQLSKRTAEAHAAKVAAAEVTHAAGEGARVEDRLRLRGEVLARLPTVEMSTQKLSELIAAPIHELAGMLIGLRSEGAIHGRIGRTYEGDEWLWRRPVCACQGTCSTVVAHVSKLCGACDYSGCQRVGEGEADHAPCKRPFSARVAAYLTAHAQAPFNELLGELDVDDVHALWATLMHMHREGHAECCAAEEDAGLSAWKLTPQARSLGLAPNGDIALPAGWHAIDPSRLQHDDGHEARYNATASCWEQKLAGTVSWSPASSRTEAMERR